ncbi:hypothetical protein [Meridianimaribacter flavus]|uniref:Uncharacterized protein n=1 Tax=Meridianimaribacter flavus TaxID=571115 RepID=A0ABY2G9J5_9FLAO|nr:hypothetical protein [Meridianimaribacter flavus]TDY14146.1 hypothetical protein A8975_0748 [Meridianimaribacter flavus]
MTAKDVYNIAKTLLPEQEYTHLFKLIKNDFPSEENFNFKKLKRNSFKIEDLKVQQYLLKTVFNKSIIEERQKSLNS